MTPQPALLTRTGAVAIEGRVLAIEGPSGSGKSTLALALIDRGAGLIGDDGVAVTREGTQVIAGPPPHIVGLIEIRGVGIVKLPVADPAPLALILTLGAGHGERMPDELPVRDILGCEVPVLPFDPGGIAPALRAEWALRLHGLGAQ